MRRETYFVRGTNGHGKPIEVFQPNLGAAQTTRDRLIAEGISDAYIEQWNYGEEPERVG